MSTGADWEKISDFILKDRYMKITLTNLCMVWRESEILDLNGSTIWRKRWRALWWENRPVSVMQNQGYRVIAKRKLGTFSDRCGRGRSCTIYNTWIRDSLNVRCRYDDVDMVQRVRGKGPFSKHQKGTKNNSHIESECQKTSWSRVFRGYS